MQHLLLMAPCQRTWLAMLCRWIILIHGEVIACAGQTRSSNFWATAVSSKFSIKKSIRPLSMACTGWIRLFGLGTYVTTTQTLKRVSKCSSPSKMTSTACSFISARTLPSVCLQRFKQNQSRCSKTGALCGTRNCLVKATVDGSVAGWRNIGIHGDNYSKKYRNPWRNHVSFRVIYAPRILWCFFFCHVAIQKITEIQSALQLTKTTWLM